MQEERYPMPLVIRIGLGYLAKTLYEKSRLRQCFGVGLKGPVLRMKAHREPVALTGVCELYPLELTRPPLSTKPPDTASSPPW